MRKRRLEECFGNVPGRGEEDDVRKMVEIKSRAVEERERGKAAISREGHKLLGVI